MKSYGSDFIVIREFKSFICIIEGEFDNCPKKCLYLKDSLFDMCYMVLEDIYVCNMGNNRLVYINRVIARLRIIDFMLKRCVDMGIISYKRFLFLGNKLNSVVRMCYGWLKSEKSKLEV